MARPYTLSTVPFTRGRTCGVRDTMEPVPRAAPARRAGRVAS